MRARDARIKELERGTNRNQRITALEERVQGLEKDLAKANSDLLRIVIPVSLYCRIRHTRSKR
jgi:hypothetical protein